MAPGTFLIRANRPSSHENAIERGKGEGRARRSSAKGRPNEKQEEFGERAEVPLKWLNWSGIAAIQLLGIKCIAAVSHL